MMALWSAALAIIAGFAVLAFSPTLKIWQQRIIAVRAAWLTMGEMWNAAWERAHNVYPEMRRRVKQDV